MTHSTERGRPPAHEEPSPGINRRQSVASINDSSAGNPEMPGHEDPYTDLPHPADTLDEPERPHRIPLRKRLLRLSDLATLPAVEPLVDGIIYRDTLAQLAGAPGSYKSFATVGLSVAVAAGENWEGHRVPRSGKVVYVAAEGATGLRARILAYCELSRINPEVLEGRLFILPCPIQLGEFVDVAEAIELVQEVGADLLVLDTRARCTVGLEENSATEQGKAIHSLETIQAAAHCAVLSVHHSARSGNAGRGSNSWDGAVWSDLRLEGSDLMAKLHVEKHKDVPAGIDYHYRLIPHTVSPALMSGVDEQQRQTLVLVQADATSENGVRTNDRAIDKHAAQLLDIIRTKMTNTGLSGAVMRDLATEEKMTRTAFYEALKLLVDRGHLRNEGTPRNTRYVLTAAALTLATAA
ncbi:helicase RepA family protein [Rhodococcus qingshengii]|uniref:AAA family ATPase n=1 Tax=Rhodococcus qingshengii TaxID=334542 RepID=UPI001E365A67|nr:AAA family ATPase [Rhodococcus qingshengii]MCD2134718.1 helicase RepA family protein [Rhodococcus qingshengii]